MPVPLRASGKHQRQFQPAQDPELRAGESQAQDPELRAGDIWEKVMGIPFPGRPPSLQCWVVAWHLALAPRT